MPKTPMIRAERKMRRPEAHVPGERVREVGAQHEEGAVREVDHAHEAEDDVETQGDEDVEHPEGDAVEKLVKQVLKGHLRRFNSLAETLFTNGESNETSVG